MNFTSKNKFKVLAVFFVSVSLSFAIQTVPGPAMDVTQSELVQILNENPEVIILDIRWDAVYIEGHLKGAILIDSSLPETNKQREADKILTQKGVNKTHPIVSVCNCGDGGYARKMEQYLINVGYTNTYHLKTSFELWNANIYPLVGGPNPEGFPVTVTPNLAGVPESNPLNDIGFIILILGSASIGGYFIYSALKKPVTNEQIKKSIQISEKKKVQELQTLKQIVSDKAEKKTGTTVSSKQKRRRR